MGALEDNNTEFLGNNLAELFFSPSSVIFLFPLRIYLDLYFERSFGVIQGIVPFS